MIRIDIENIVWTKDEAYRMLLRISIHCHMLKDNESSFQAQIPYGELSQKYAHIMH